MPLYEYRCSRCDRLFEELVVSGDQEVACPDCGSAELEREFSTFSSGGGCRPSGGFG